MPSLWPRMKNVVDGGGRESEAAGESLEASTGGREREEKRDVAEEARREVEEEEEVEERERREGMRMRMRWRGGGRTESEGRRERDFAMPGGMPGMMVS